MPARHRARKRALDILFEADQRGAAPAEIVQQRKVAAEHPLAPYTLELVSGVTGCQARIDEILTTYSHGWTLDRMPGVDRVALRIGVWEILFNEDVPDAVAIDEAVNLVKEMSTDESPSFVNGLLARVIELKPMLLA